MKQNIVVGPKSREKRERAKALRREMTEAEARLWDCLRGNQCGGRHFRRQQIIDGFIADFYCHAASLIIEVDGEIHAQQVDYDRLRERVLSTRGLRIMRFTNERVLNEIERVLAEIRAAVVKREEVSPTGC